MQILPYYIQLIYTTVRLYTTVNKTTWFSSSCRLYPTHAAFINNDDVVQGKNVKLNGHIKKIQTVVYTTQ